MRKEIAEYIERRDGYPSSPNVRFFLQSLMLAHTTVCIPCPGNACSANGASACIKVM